MLATSLLVAAALAFSLVVKAVSITDARDSNGEAAAVREYFYVGGNYVNTSSGHLFSNQMYVEQLTPTNPCQSYPLVFIHGQAQTGTVNLPNSTTEWS